MTEDTRICTIGDLFCEWVEAEFGDSPGYKLGRSVGRREGYRQAKADLAGNLHAFSDEMRDITRPRRRGGPDAA